MKVIKSYWKSCLCFLLTFFCILGLLYSSNNTFALSGNGYAVGHGSLGGGGTGADNGLNTNANGFRIGAFNIDADDNGYFSFDGETVTLLKDPSKMNHYYPSVSDDCWLYFTPFNKGRAGAASDRTNGFIFKDSSGLNAGYSTAVTRNLSEPGDPDGKRILQALGLTTVSAYTTGDAGKKFNEVVTDVCNRIHNIKSGSDAEKVFEDVYGFDKSRAYIIVVEIIDAYSIKSVSTQNNYLGRVAGNAGVALKDYGGFTKHSPNHSFTSLYQSEPPVGASKLNRNGLEGMAIYGDPLKDSGKKSGSNIMVTYTGETNTSDASKFTSRGTFALADGGALHTWNGSDWSDSFTVNMSKTGSEYTVVKAGKAKLTGSGGSAKVSDILSKMDSIGGFNLTWGTSNVTGGDFHAGIKTSVTAIDGDSTAKPIVKRLNGSVTNLEATWGSPINSCVDYNTANHEDTSNLVKGVMAEAYNDYTDDNALTKKGNLKKDKSVGLGVEFLVKGTKVTSTHYRITLKSDGSARVNKVTDINYTTASSGRTNLSDNAICVAVAKWTDANNNSSAVGQNFPSVTTPENVLSTLESRLTNVEVSSVVSGGESIVVGSTSDNKGYVIYEVVADGITPPQGTVSLEDWFLNKYIDNIINTSSSNVGSPMTYRLKRDYTDKYNEPTWSTLDCGAKLMTGVNQDYNIIYTETSSGTEVSWDNSISKLYYPAASGNTYPSTASRYKFKPNITIDTKNLSGSTVVDYAFNFTRTSVDDVRSFSGISYSNYASLDPTNLLKMSDKFGVVPTVKSTSNGKNQLVGSISENLKLETKFQYAGGVGKHARWDTHNAHVYKYITIKTDAGTFSRPVVCPTCSYIASFEPHTCNGLWANAFPVNKMDYTFVGNVYKYQTSNKEEGKNSLLGSSDMKALATNANIPTGVTKENTNEYRYATVHRNTGVDIGFYPENYMAYKIGGTVFDSNPYKYAEVISEAKRTAESSSLYLFKINTDKDSDVITGSTYSDTMQGGTSSMGSTKVSIPAGSDVTILADTSNIKIDLYGYALDLVNKSKDSTMKTGSSSSMSYGSVVKQNDIDLNASWGNNSNNPDKLKSNFSDWADKIMDINNFAADFTLSVNNATKGANFSATIGKVNHTSGATEDGVYNINVENGQIVKTGANSRAYQQLIKQIAADYDCSEAEAEQVFTDSQIYTAIMNAIESSNSSSNTSGACTVGASSWTDTLGGNGNWYDEKVRTFVVRRYTNLGNTLSDITATDKIDYGLAPSGSNSGKENSSAGTAYDAKWSLSLFFNSAKKDDMNKLLLENGTYYDPSTNTEISGANNAHSVLINNTPVSNADFLVPASSTSNFGF